MRRLALRFSTLIVTFLLGLGIFTLLEMTTRCDAKLSLEDEWHRLYEAASMSGRDDLREQVNNGLMCANREGRAAGKLNVETSIGFCELPDGSMHLILIPDGDYGIYHKKITDSHLRWAVGNLEFVKMVTNRSAASRYVVSNRKIVGLAE